MQPMKTSWYASIMFPRGENVYLFLDCVVPTMFQQVPNDFPQIFAKFPMCFPICS
jgi:hypothetical protein